MLQVVCLSALLVSFTSGYHVSRVSPLSGNVKCGACINGVQECVSTRPSAPLTNLNSNAPCTLGKGPMPTYDCPKWNAVNPRIVSDVDSASAWDSSYTVIPVSGPQLSCGTGFYLFGFRGQCDGTGMRTGFPTVALCKRATNLPIAWANGNQIVTNVANPWDGAAGDFNCPTKTYLVGIGKGKSASIDGTQLLCATPPDATCSAPPDQNTTSTILAPECANNIHQYCVVALSCKNQYLYAISGASYVECQASGSYNDTFLKCVDINECANTTICPTNSYCTNVVGVAPGYTCSCNPGYKKNIITGDCVDVDECLVPCTNSKEPDPVGKGCYVCPSGTICQDAPGNFTCALPPDPCLTTCNSTYKTYCNNCSSLASCTNTNPTYTCTCANGYTSSDGGRTCTDVNECVTQSPCLLSTSTCMNLNGSYACVCLGGYSQVNSTAQCTPINECNNSVSVCPDRSQCVDTTPYYYCLPQIIAVSKGGVPAPFVLGSTAQVSAEVVVFTVRSEVYCSRTNVVYYGANNQFMTAACSVVVGSANSYQLSCGMGPGAGMNLTFALQCCPNSTYPVSQQCVYVPALQFVFSYPAPVLMSNTLTYVGSADAQGTANLNATQSGTLLTMQGSNFYGPETLVYFGTAAEPLKYTCQIASVNFTSVVCVPVTVTGANYSFVVEVGLQPSNNQSSVRGQDLLSFVGDPPVLNSLTGCTIDTSVVAPPGGINNCPTAGGSVLTVVAATAKGVRLTAPQLFVGGKKCLMVGNVSVGGFSCTLPAGVGEFVSVELRDVTASWFGDVVSYAPPQITQITSTSCMNASLLTLVNCSGAISLSIAGDNFGASGATVSVNSVILPATHFIAFAGQSPSGLNGLHKHLVVSIPSTVVVVGSNVVVVKQLNGVWSEEAGVFSVVGCGVGQGRNNGTAVCMNCNIGRYASGGLCFDCTPGFYQASAGQTVCVQCEPGKAQSNAAQSGCLACGAGSASSNQSIYCIPCDPGKFSVSLVNSVCTDCSAGTFQSNSNASACAACVIGTYSISNANACNPCPPGRVSQTNSSVTCVLCPPGTYQDTPGLSSCQDCIPGFYNAFPGSPFCSSCLPGAYQNLTRQTTCSMCPVGSLQSNEQATACVLCDPGSYSNRLASTSCVDCAPGQFSNDTGASMCSYCPQGTAQSDSGSIDCDTCMRGYFSPTIGLATCSPCDPGFWQNNTGASFCQPCPSGFYANSKAAYACRECSAGTFQPGVGQQRCLECNPGLYQPSTAAITCLSCPAGTASTVDASASCVQCPAATYSDPQASVCLSCPFNSIQPSVGQGSCVRCGEGSSPNELGTQCQCQAGYYANPFVNGTLFEGCVQCPPGSGTCNAVGQTFDSITTLNGWWRASVNASSFYRCVTPLFCLGGDKCADFREGPMCALCVEGYKSGGVGDACSACPKSRGDSWGITIAIVICLIILLIVMYYIALRVANAQQQRLIHIVNVNNMIAQERLRTMIAKDDAYFDEQRRSHRIRTEGADTTEDTGDFETDETPEATNDKSSIRDIKITVQDTSRRAPNFMYKVKILIGFFQIASYLPAQGDIAWPQAFYDFISSFAIFNFDFIPWQTLGCAAGVNYFVKTIIVGTVPVVAAIVLATAFAVSSLIADTRSLETQLERGQRQRAQFRHFVRLLLFTSFLLYPLVSKIALGIYNCVTIDGVSYLIADFELLCYDETWRTYAIIDGFFVALYPIGIPILYFAILASRRKQMREPETILVLGFLYEAYTDTAWYWELVDMTHKLILTSAIVFVSNEQRMAWNMAIMGAYLMALLVAVPYVRKGDDRFHLQVQATLFCIAFVGFILRQDNPYQSAYASPSEMEGLIAALLICIVLLLLISFVVISGRNIHKSFRHRKSEKQRTARYLAQLAAGETTQNKSVPAQSESSSNLPVGQTQHSTLP